ncbi:MerR family transcriptional regulator [Actinomadura sp. NBRC 104412]|uniref:MerR family transcriptional regulator n=1 Tax=Actinomadura sp. NBRC 104412 TaxID=3032203 RepID=UPI0024A4718A|nr:MerR family transcriptional regulator [Actinomadura sp. NBRC 104412]GLZ04256.1 MerR family transcriptional regulator [Actinomadura sp. NBRC 104412]
MTFYSPGQAAEKSGFSIDTLRYYEKIGLLEGIARSASGRRLFSEDDLAWLHMLRCLRDTGMPIAEMRRYAELVRGGDGTLRDRLALLREHDRRVEEQIARLRTQQGHIRWKIDLYQGLAGTGGAGCAASAANGDCAGEMADGDAAVEVTAAAG